MASLDNSFANDERPTLPLYFRYACSAIFFSRPLGQPGNSSRILSANLCTYFLSNASRRIDARSLRFSLYSLSEKHSFSANSRPFSSTNNPCLSYCLRALLHFKTTADKVEYFVDRLVRAASPEGKKIK